MTSNNNNTSSTTTNTTTNNNNAIPPSLVYYKSSKSDTHQIAGLYDLEETIGQGHFAVVKLARHIFTGEKVAIKVIDKTKLDQISREHLFQEVKCMKLVQHRNVVKLYEVIDTTTKLYLILELGDGGDMYDYIMKHTNGLSECKARNYFKQILRAIKYCHDLHVVHRDLKPENVVFFERTGEVKLTDFGFSNVFQPGTKLNTSCGSLAYSAPEILLGDSYDAPAVDVWSLGVILYMLCTGHAPFQEANDSETLTMILDCKYYLPPELSSECKNLISRMLVREPEKRILLEDIAKHEWMTNYDADDDDDDENNTLVSSNSNDDNLPLIKSKRLTPQEENEIIDNMIKGNIATYDEIIRAVKEDKYNYITATYYLLAERILKRRIAQQVTNQSNLNKKPLHRPQPQLPQQQVPATQQQQPLKQLKPNNNKRKFNNLVISEVNADNDDDDSGEIKINDTNKENEKLFNECSPRKLKTTSDLHIEQQYQEQPEPVAVNDSIELIDCENIDETNTSSTSSTITNSINNNNNNTNSVTSSNSSGGSGGSGSNRQRQQREVLPFAIPEEVEETNVSFDLSHKNKSTTSSSSSTTTTTTTSKQAHNVHNSPHLLNEISEEAESDHYGDNEEELNELNEAKLKLNEHENDKLKNQQQQQQQLILINNRNKKLSVSASSTDIDDDDYDTEAAKFSSNDPTKLNLHKLQKRLKKQQQKQQQQQQGRTRPVSISDVSGGEEQGPIMNHAKVTLRAKSVESTDISPLKVPNSLNIPGGGNNGGISNDLAPPLNYNLKSLSIEHRLANISQMSISSQLSKTNSIRHNSRSGACDTPIQHVHSSTPTPRESVVFNRGDEKPIAKILLQQQLSKTTSNNKTTNLNGGQQQSIVSQDKSQLQLTNGGGGAGSFSINTQNGHLNGNINKNINNNGQEQLKINFDRKLRNNSESSTVSNVIINSRTVSTAHSTADDNDGDNSSQAVSDVDDLSEYENTLKSNATVVNAKNKVTTTTSKEKIVSNITKTSPLLNHLNIINNGSSINNNNSNHVIKHINSDTKLNNKINTHLLLSPSSNTKSNSMSSMHSNNNNDAKNSNVKLTSSNNKEAASNGASCNRCCCIL